MDPEGCAGLPAKQPVLRYPALEPEAERRPGAAGYVRLEPELQELRRPDRQHNLIEIFVDAAADTRDRGTLRPIRRETQVDADRSQK